MAPETYRCLQLYIYKLYYKGSAPHISFLSSLASALDLVVVDLVVVVALESFFTVALEEDFLDFSDVDGITSALTAATAAAPPSAPTKYVPTCSKDSELIKSPLYRAAQID